MAEGTDRLPVALIVGDHLRHCFVAWRLVSDPRLDVRAIVSETKRSWAPGKTEEESRVIAEHREERARAEERYFGGSLGWEELGPPLKRVAQGESNDPAVADWVRGHGPRFLVLNGCSIIRDPLLGAFADRTVNLHLGLSPFYRGSATNFWPLVNGEPECVGATIHIATPVVDAGPILVQVRAEVAPEDGPHDLGCKTIAAGVNALAGALCEYAAGERTPVPQQPGGRVCRNADFGAEPVLQVRRRFAEGMIPEYLAHKPERDARFPIVA